MRLNDSELNSVCKHRTTSAKDWLWALKTELNLLKLGDVERWVEASRNLAYTDEVDQSATTFRQRNLTLECMARNCCRISVTDKEMLRHVRNDHDLTSNSTDHDQESVTTPRNPPCQCPLTGCNKTYKTVGWWKRHMRYVHPQSTIIDEDSAAPIDVTVESERSNKKEIYPAQVDVIPHDIEASVTIAVRYLVAPSAQSFILSRKVYKITVQECMAGQIQETKQSVSERLEALKPKNTHPSVPRAPDEHKL